ncbi:MAG: LysM peptidoglycan-binding domain-containing protein [Fluviicola sp.]
MSEGKLVKLTIQGYEDATFNKKMGNLYTTLINPEKITLSRKVEFDSKQADGETKTPQRFKRMIPADLDLSILFDATGVIAGASRGKDIGRNASGDDNLYYSVSEQLNEFEDVVIGFKGETHKPNHLWVIWGDLDFQGVLQDYTVEHKIFNPNGSPLRSVVKLKLKEASDAERAAAEADKQSPDLTHIRQVVEGDTLPRMCDTIYGNSKYYLEVARVNGLTNFRKLQPGQRINFPPLEKLNT